MIAANAAASTTSNAATITPVALGTEPLSGSIYGDLNRDGAVNTADVAMLRDVVAALQPLGVPTAVADVNGDGVVDAVDLSIVAGYAGGTVPCLPQFATVGASSLTSVAESSQPNPAQVAANPTQYFFYTPELNLMSQTEIRAAGAKPEPAIDYIWFSGHPVAEERIATNQTRYTFTDHLGTPFLQTDTAGAPIWRVEYEPHGTAYTLRTGNNADQRLRFPGQEFDEQTPGREYNIFRWYRAVWGRYTHADPIGLLGGVNLFSYALLNPVHVTDRLGLDTVGCDGYMWNLETKCELQCCAQHDKCYDSNHCSSGSWFFKRPKCGCDQTAGCKKCNADAAFCVAKCNTTADAGSSTGAMFYCPNQHRFIHIPGDFPDRATAAKACEYDYSKDCTTPLRKPKPQVFQWGPKYYSASGI